MSIASSLPTVLAACALQAVLPPLSFVPVPPLTGTGPPTTQQGLCAVAQRILEDQAGMITEVAVAIMPDWRTGEGRTGCSLVAAGGSEDMQWLISTVSSTLERAGWSTFFEAYTSAHGSTFSYGLQDVECSYGVFPAGVLATSREEALQARAEPVPGHRRYTVTAACLPRG